MSVVLMYHDIVMQHDKSSGFQNDSAFQYKVDEMTFGEQVKALRGKDVVFTFDDGGDSFYTKAAPILEKYGFKGVFFISTKYINTPGFLNPEQIQELAEKGHVIGSHTHSHPDNLSKLTPKEIITEWKKSHSILCEIIGEDEITASIPNGNSSKIVIEEAFNQGFTDIYTSQPTTRVKRIGKHKIIGRYVVHNNMTVQDIVNIATSKKTQIKMAFKWHLLNILKKILGSSYKKLKSKIIR